MASSSLPAVRDELVRLWARLARFWGVPPTTAQVHAFLLSCADGADGERIAAELGTSRGAVSTACRELQDWGLVAPEPVPGTRRVRFRAETDPERVVRAVVATRKRREWDPLLETVGALAERLEDAKGEDAEALRRRLRALEGVIGLADDAATRFLEGRTLSKLGLAAVAVAARRRSRRGPRPR